MRKRSSGGGLVVALFACLTTSLAVAVDCRSDSWVFYGSVLDASGNPAPHADVYLLLDEVSQKKFHRAGVRGRRFSTNQYGKYQAGLICGEGFDRANPCAKKPKHLTVMASSDGSPGMKAQVFKLKSLEIVEHEGVCFVQVPEIRVRAGF